MEVEITKENSVHFVVKKVWFDKLKSGEKTHEYRLFKPHWNRRLLYKTPGKYIPLPKKYARFSLGMTTDPDKNLIFEIKNISLIRAAESDLAIMYPELKNSCELVHDIEVGKRIK